MDKSKDDDMVKVRIARNQKKNERKKRLPKLREGAKPWRMNKRFNKSPSELNPLTPTTAMNNIMCTHKKVSF